MIRMEKFIWEGIFSANKFPTRLGQAIEMVFHLPFTLFIYFFFFNFFCHQFRLHLWVTIFALIKTFTFSPTKLERKKRPRRWTYDDLDDVNNISVHGSTFFIINDDSTNNVTIPNEARDNHRATTVGILCVC